MGLLLATDKTQSKSDSGLKMKIIQLRGSTVAAWDVHLLLWRNSKLRGTDLALLLPTLLYLFKGAP